MLTLHVMVSVGWLGGVAGAFALAIAGMTSQDVQLVRAAYLALELLSVYVLVPLSVASLVTGIVQSLGTTWGLFRHYWVLAKLLINLTATLVLVLETRAVGDLAAMAALPTLNGANLAMLQTPDMVTHTAGGLGLLLLATVLAVYKPRGMTPYGLRKQRIRQGDRQKVLVRSEA
jgi:hypothetical protein